MMTQTAFEHQLSEYLRGELSPDDRRAMARYIQGHPEVLEHLEALRAVVAVTEQIRAEQPPEGLFETARAAVLARLQEREALSTPRRWGAWLAGRTLVQRPRRRPGVGLAAAAVLVVVLTVGVWVGVQRHPSAVRSHTLTARSTPPSPQTGQTRHTARSTAVTRESTTGARTPERHPASSQRRPLPAIRPHSEDTRPTMVEFSADPATFIPQPTVAIPFLDVVTAKHLEQAHVLLRSFRNTPVSAGELDVSYEQERSRRLLTQNILLRRDAEAKGNLPVVDVLSILEPFLSDLAHVQPHASPDEVRAIKARIQKHEILIVLQSYTLAL